MRKGVIKCPNCEAFWDTNLKDECEYCGATIATSINNFSIGIKYDIEIMPEDHKRNWVPCGDIYGEPVEKVLRFYPEN